MPPLIVVLRPLFPLIPTEPPILKLVPPFFFLLEREERVLLELLREEVDCTLRPLEVDVRVERVERELVVRLLVTLDDFFTLAAFASTASAASGVNASTKIIVKGRTRVNWEHFIITTINFRQPLLLWRPCEVE